MHTPGWETSWANVPHDASGSIGLLTPGGTGDVFLTSPALSLHSSSGSSHSSGNTPSVASITSRENDSTPHDSTPPDTPNSLGNASAGSASSGSNSEQPPLLPTPQPVTASGRPARATAGQSRHALSVKTEEVHQPSYHHGSTLTAQQQAAALAEQQAHRAAERASEGADDDDGDDDEGGAASTKTQKRGHGSSCHQCKTTKDPQYLYFCTNKAEKGIRKRRCRKKYCDSCLKRSYGNDTSEIIPSWQCPSCLGVCICAACHRKSSKKSAAAGLPPQSAAAAAAAAANHHSSQQAEAIRNAALQERRNAEQSGDDAPLSMPPNKRANSNSSTRISLSPLTISRNLSGDEGTGSGRHSHREAQQAANSKLSGVGDNIRLSPRFSSRSLATGRGNSSNNLAALADNDVDPSYMQPQDPELEKLMVGMNMQQRQAFLHEAAHLIPNPQGTGILSKVGGPNSLHNSPRGSPRSIKRKLAGVAGADLSSPTQHVKYNMQQRVKNQLAALDDDTTPIGLPPSHHQTPNSSSRRITPAPLSHLGLHHSPAAAPQPAALSTPSVPDDLVVTGTDPDGVAFAPPTSMFSATAADLMPGANTHHQYNPSSHALHPSTTSPSAGIPILPPMHTTYSAEERAPHRLKLDSDALKVDPSYLGWGSSGTGATPNPAHHNSAFLSPLPGSLHMNYPHGGAGNSSMLLGSPNPLHFGSSGGNEATPGGYSSANSSSLFSPNPSASPINIGTESSSPLTYGAGGTLSYPTSYLPPAEEHTFSMRQLSLGGQNIIMGGVDGLERGMSALGGPSSRLTSAMDKDIVQSMWNSDAAAWRQTSANATMPISTTSPQLHSLPPPTAAVEPAAP